MIACSAALPSSKLTSLPQPLYSSAGKMLPAKFLSFNKRQNLNETQDLVEIFK